MSTRLKGLLALFAAFVAGTVTGIALTLFFSGRPAWDHPRGRPGPEAAVQRLSRELNLTPEQQNGARTIILRHHEEMEEEIARVKAFGLNFMTRIFAELAPLLTPEQKEKAKELLEARKKRAFPPPPPR